MKFTDFKNNIKNLLIFTKNDLRLLESRDSALDVNIKYWLQQGKIIKLKNGVYVLTEKYNQEKDKDIFLEYIANQLLKPSYLSLEYVLAKYQVLSEPVQALTSITIKTTREINNQLAIFRYYSLANKLFQGYQLKKVNDFYIKEATLAKALFDYLYLRFWREKNISEQSILNLRLNWENVKLKDLNRAASYVNFSKNKKIKQVFRLIKEKYVSRGII